MVEKTNDALTHLRALSNGTYQVDRTPYLDLAQAPLFAGLSRASLDFREFELLPGLHLRRAYAHLFSPPMVAVAPPSAPSAVHPSPWYAVENGHAAETVQIELSIAAGARPLDMPRMASLRLVAAAIRILSSQPVCLPILCNVPFAEARQPTGQVHLWRLEQPLAISGQPVELTQSFLESLARILPQIQALRSRPDVDRAFILADGLWWLPSPEAQLLAIWTVIEILMRPGRRDTTKSLARTVRAYISQDRASGDRLYQEVIRLYFARGNSAHAGAEAVMQDVRSSYMILREILLRALIERQRPPRPDDI